MNKTIYFDNNATTHMDLLVAERMHELNVEGITNPASQHGRGRHALHLLEEAKSLILESVGARQDGTQSARVILTSGGTEANNLAVFGLLARRPGIAIVGATDHPSVMEPARLACGHKGQLRVLPVNRHGICDLNLLESWLAEIYATGTEQVSFVSVMLGNNETGILQDLKAICSICAKYHIPVHSDVVQAVGKIPVDMQDLGLAALTLTAHKIHGPVGIGALILAPDCLVEPCIVGGGQQLGTRAGTEPVVAAVGLATALRQICRALDDGVYERVRGLRDEFELQISRLCEVLVVGGETLRLPHTSSLSFVGFDRQALQMALDLNGLACSTGSACASGSGKPAGSLLAMGLDGEIIRGTLRFSFSRYSTEEELGEAIKIVARAIQRSTINT